MFRTPNLGGAQRFLWDPECHQMLMSPCLDQSEEKTQMGSSLSWVTWIRPQQAASREHALFELNSAVRRLEWKFTAPNLCRLQSPQSIRASRVTW